MLSDAELRCRVCGLLQEMPPWGEDGRSPTYDFCACCGTEFGYQDSSRVGVIRRRHEWLASGAKWADPSVKPQPWDPMEQLSSVPLAWRCEHSLGDEPT